MAQTVKRLSTMQETWVGSLGWEDSLEKEMATHSCTLALKIPWTEELGAGYCLWGRKESGTRGNGTPLQYSCLENPMDGRAWWAAVHGVTQSRTRLKQLSIVVPVATSMTPPTQPDNTL